MKSVSCGLFIDADEFLFPLNEGESVANIVSSILDVEPKAGGLAVNWRMFGSSFHEEKPYGGGYWKIICTVLLKTERAMTA